MHPGVAKSCGPRSTDLMRTASQPQVREDTSSLRYIIDTVGNLEDVDILEEAETGGILKDV